MLIRRYVAACAVALVAATSSALVAAADFPPPTETVTPPDTAACPYKTSPWPAIDTSEDVPTGQPAPAPLAVPADPVGGGRLGDCGFVLADGAAALPSDISAHAWMVADLTTRQVIGGKDVHGRYRPASTLKLLTMLVIFRNLPDFTQTVIGTQTDADQDGSRVGMGAGGVYTINDLMLGLMMNSGNDCANALARANGGWDKTLADMNSAAAALGAHDTRAATVSGLDAPGQQTSAYDLALFAQADVKLPRFLPMLSTDTAMFPGFDTYPAFGMANDNQLLGNYPGALGGKTGFTDDAGNTYVGIAERNGHRLVVTMMGGTQQPRRQWMQAASLLDWGFAAVQANTAPVGTLVDPDVDAAASASSSSPSATTTSGTSATSTPTTGNPGTTSPGAAAAADSSESSTTWIWIVVALAALLVGGILGGYWYTSRRSSAVAPAADPGPGSTGPGSPASSDAEPAPEASDAADAPATFDAAATPETPDAPGATDEPPAADDTSGDTR